MTLYATYCSRTKSDLKEGTPEELYISKRIKAFFKYAPVPRAILSYKYGIVYETEIIDNYEQKTWDQETIINFQKRRKDGYMVVWFPRQLEEKPWISLLNQIRYFSYDIIRKIKNDPVRNCGNCGDCRVNNFGDFCISSKRHGTFRHPDMSCQYWVPRQIQTKISDFLKITL